MSDYTTYRLNKVCRELKVGLGTAVDFLSRTGIVIPKDPNIKINEDVYQSLKKEFLPETFAGLQLKARMAVEREDYQTAAKLMKEIKQYKTGDL